MPYYRGLPGPGGANGRLDELGPIPVALAVQDKQVPENEILPEESASPAATLRTYFPETWLWNLERTGYDFLCRSSVFVLCLTYQKVLCNNNSESKYTV